MVGGRKCVVWQMDDICPILWIGVLGRGKEGPVRMRVLVAYEHRYRLYRESLAREIRLSRPRLEVHHADAGQLAETLRTLDPHVVSAMPTTKRIAVGGRRGSVFRRTPHDRRTSASTASTKNDPTRAWTSCWASWTRRRRGSEEDLFRPAANGSRPRRGARRTPAPEAANAPPALPGCSRCGCARSSGICAASGRSLRCPGHPPRPARPPSPWG
jgi:hypothetical protein